MVSITESLLNPRLTLQNLLLTKQTAKVLEMAGMLHGHFCPGLALGVKVVEAGFSRLGISDNSGMEEIMAVVECNNCFVDGVQFAAGCTLGNNSLVYQDLGKTAATFYRRGSEDAIRLCVKSFDISTADESDKTEGDALFDKAVKRRETLTDDESRRLKEIQIRRSFAVAQSADEALFSITPCPAPRFSYAPIFDSQQCSVCGEKVMETRARIRNGKPICIACSHDEFGMVLGRGIATGNNVA